MFKTKFNSYRFVERCKARLVLRSYKQIKGKDYKNAFSLVAKFITVRTLIALVAANNWHLQQLYINNAFLYDFIDDDIYMTIPLGYTKTAPGLICKLKRSIYGFRKLLHCLPNI